MGRVDCQLQLENGGKRKSEFQLQSLERFYMGGKYPERKTMEGYGTYLGLTYNQVRIWFSERRRREKKKRISSTNKIQVADDSCRKGPGNKGKQISSPSKKTTGSESESSESSQANGIEPGPDSHNKPAGKGGRKLDRGISQSTMRAREASNNEKRGSGSSVTNKQASKGQLRCTSGSRNSLGRNPLGRVQVLLSQDDILKSVFRKDGPPLGVKFDYLPARGFDCHTRHNKCPPFNKDRKRASHKQKVSEFSVIDCCNLNNKSISTGRYGIGKGLMTVWRATQPTGGFPVGLSLSDRGFAQNLTSTNNPKKTTSRGLNTQHQQNRIMKASRKKVERRTQQLKRTKALCTKNNNNKSKQQLPSVECGLLFGDLKYEGQSNSSTVLMDDEELELTELQAGPNPFRCLAHLTSNGGNGCPLCKDMLDRFPPQSVNMKQPICLRPWVSSPDIVKKLFKVFRFLYTCADKLNICYFTLDEFTQAFHEKDSILLGKIHVALLTFLLSNVYAGISSRFPLTSKDSRFLLFIHSVNHQDFDVAFWIQSLNALTWIEILRQVCIAAGFGSMGYCTRRETLIKEGNHMAKYGLRPHTLKGELFCILSEQGSRGSKISELARASQIVALGLPSRTDELECLISSTLSSDITLFEKIGTSVFRLRTGLSHKTEDTSDSYSDDSGSIDIDHFSSNSGSLSDECEFIPPELDSSLCVQPIVPYEGRPEKKCKRTRKCIEIDESFPGEAWLLGLMEGEYSDLGIEEKLDALVSLVDLTSSASCLGIDNVTSSNVPNIWCHRSGAKIKKLSSQPVPLDSTAIKSRDFQEVCSLERKLVYNGTTQKSRADETEQHWHPLHAINLGSDRRYNSYWLFLGPCETRDPGHRRVYFESSEDGHWEVIDSKQALSSLLSALDCRGKRESHLFTSLEKREGFLRKAMTEYTEAKTGVAQRKLADSPHSDAFSGNGSSLMSDVDNNVVSGESTNTCTVSPGVLVEENETKYVDKNVKWDQLEAFDKWIWESFFGSLNAVKNRKSSYHDSLVHCERCHDLFWRDEKHCKICHTTFELDFDLEEKYAIHIATCESNGTSFSSSHKVLPSQLQALKAAIHAIEIATPEEALVGWTKSSHKLWGKRLRRTSSLPEFFQVVKDFVGAIKEDWLYEHTLSPGLNNLDDAIILFQTMPQTVAAVALWIVKLDILIAPCLKRINSNDAVISMPRPKRMRTRPR